MVDRNMSCHLKFFLLVIIVLEGQIDFNHFQKQKWIDYCKDDLRLCADCFSLENGTDLTEATCDEVFDEYEFNDQSFVNTFNSLFGDREIEFGYNKTGTQRVVRKRLVARDVIESVLTDLGIGNLSNVEDTDTSKLQQYFLDENRVGGSYICHPNVTLDKFYQILPVRLKHRKTFWLLLNFNIQPLILTLFDHGDLPFPRQLALVGLTSVTKNMGESLVNYVTSTFQVRLRISKLVLEAVLKLTNDTSLKGYRIYLTDLTLDNIVYDPDSDAIYFVDLDNIILMDSHLFNSSPKANDIHKHEKIECNGCFAYSIENICSCPTSDINIFAVCQLLYEDLYEDRTQGFLHSVPGHLPEILQVLDHCVNCKERNCDRFKSASKLLELFDQILRDV